MTPLEQLKQRARDLIEARKKATQGKWKALLQDGQSSEKWYDIWTDNGSVAHCSEIARPYND